jgi:hypothetical protein
MATNLLERNNVTALERIVKLEDELAAAKKLLEQRPAEPSGMGTVVRFKKFGQAYSFAAIRVADGIVTHNGYWYVTQDGTRTSRQGIPPKTWDGLLDWIGERNFGTIEVLS